jgi:hypothetical protein
MYKYIQDFIRNNSRSIFSDCTVPQKKAVSEIVRGLFIAGTPILRHLVQSEKKTAKKQAEKYSHHLGNINLKEKVEAFSLKKVKNEVKKDTIIAYDLTDINKEFSKKMEKLSVVFDGSRRDMVDGFLLHGVGVNGMLLKLQVHEHETKTLNQVRLNIVKELAESFGGNGIWAFDRGNDGKLFFKDLRQKLKVQFVARLRVNRTVVMKKTGAMEKLENVSVGQYPVFILDKHGRTDTKTEYLLVVSKHLPNKPPIRLLCNLKEEYSSQQIVGMYLQRWGIENAFKRAKQKFNLEKIRVLNYQKFVNLIVLIQFAINVCTISFIAIQKFTDSIISGVLICYKKFIKRKSLSINLDSFISFLQKSLKPLILRPKKPKSIQISLLSRRQLEKLGSF